MLTDKQMSDHAMNLTKQLAIAMAKACAVDNGSRAADISMTATAYIAALAISSLSDMTGKSFADCFDIFASFVNKYSGN